MGRSREELSFETIRITAWTYAVYCVTIVPVAIGDTPEGLTVGSVIGCLLHAIAAASAAWRSRVGYYFCYCFSILLLPQPPIGTVIGWNMLRSLRRNRHHFGRRAKPR